MTDRLQPTPGPELTPPVAEVPDCPPGTVPGWLDESGNPTSCVGDDPLVWPSPEIGVPVDVYPPALPLDIPPELATTGLALDQWLTLFALATMLIVVGWLAWKASRRF